jgi:aminoglycoside 6'-N-acetyltransferase I
METSVNIEPGTEKDFESVVEMALTLWPDESRKEIAKEIRDIMASGRQALFVCKEKGCCVAFINVSVRKEYVPGATSYPLGYVEGIFVKPDFLRRGIATRLLARGEAWAHEHGCAQMGSDTWLWNSASQQFHVNTGFMEKERVVFYIKRIVSDSCPPPKSGR